MDDETYANIYIYKENYAWNIFLKIYNDNFSIILSLLPTDLNLCYWKHFPSILDYLLEMVSFSLPFQVPNTKVVYLKKPAKVHNKRKEVKVVNIKLLGLL